MVFILDFYFILFYFLKGWKSTRNQPHISDRAHAIACEGHDIHSMNECMNEWESSKSQIKAFLLASVCVIDPIVFRAYMNELHSFCRFFVSSQKVKRPKMHFNNKVKTNSIRIGYCDALHWFSNFVHFKRKWYFYLKMVKRSRCTQLQTVIYLHAFLRVCSQQIQQCSFTAPVILINSGWKCMRLVFWLWWLHLFCL